MTADLNSTLQTLRGLLRDRPVPLAKIAVAIYKFRLEEPSKDDDEIVMDYVAGNLDLTKYPLDTQLQLTPSLLGEDFVSFSSLLKEDHLGIDLSHAKLMKADMCYVRWQGINLSHAYMYLARLWHSSFIGANFEGAGMFRIRAFKSDFRNANLRGVYLTLSDLERNRFDGADLTGANLQSVNLQMSTFCGARLDGANLAAANLYGASLKTASLEGITYSRRTVWPKRFKIGNIGREIE